MNELEIKPFLLQENINKFFNNIPIPSYIWQKQDEDFILIDYNRAAEQITDGKIKVLIKDKASNVLKERTDIIEAINESFQSKQSISMKSDYLSEESGQKKYNSLNIHYLPPDLVIVHIKDITDWVQAEEKLRSSREKYKLLFERSPIPIVLTDLEGIIIDINLATVNQFGYQKESIIGKNYLNLGTYSPSSIPLFKNRLSRLKEGLPIEETEFEILKQDGSKVWIVNQMSIINIEDKPTVQSFIVDVTERKEFENKIKRKLENERLISTISSRLISTVDIDEALSISLLEMGALIGATRAYILLFNEERALEFYIQEWCAEGIEPQMINITNINQKTFPWVFDLGGKQELIHIRNSSDLPEESAKLKEELYRLNITSLLGFPIKIKNETYGYIGFDNIHEISEWDDLDIDILRTTSEIIGNAFERKWAEETLKSSHQLLAGILSSLTETIFLVDTHFNIMWANNVAKQLFGLKLTGEKCYRVFAHRGMPCSECIALKTFTDGKIHEVEKTFTTLNNQNINLWCSSSTAGLNLEGETELAILILRDVTALKSAEATLIESEKNLKQLNETLIQKVEERTKKLKLSEENYKRMLNDLDVGFYKGKFKGELLMHNAALNKILEVSEEISLIGSESSKFFTDPKEHERYYNILEESGYIKNFFIKLKIPNGKIIKVQLNSHLIRDSEGNPIEVEGTAIKITDINKD